MAVVPVPTSLNLTATFVDVPIVLGFGVTEVNWKVNEVDEPELTTSVVVAECIKLPLVPVMVKV